MPEVRPTKSTRTLIPELSQTWKSRPVLARWVAKTHPKPTRNRNTRSQEPSARTLEYVLQESLKPQVAQKSKLTVKASNPKPQPFHTRTRTERLRLSPGCLLTPTSSTRKSIPYLSLYPQPLKPHVGSYFAKLRQKSHIWYPFLLTRSSKAEHLHSGGPACLV